MITKIHPQFMIAAEFIIFALFASPLLYNNSENSPDHGQTIALACLLLLLFTIILVTLQLTYGRLQHSKREVQDKLREERKKNSTLQEQLQQTSQEKIYDLQVANGALNREIAERIQAEEEIRELQKQQTLILNSAGEGILGLDKRGRVIFMNLAASLMLGWKQEELLGLTHHSIIHHTHPDGTEHREEDCPIYQAYKDGKVHYKTGDLFWCKNGSSFPVEYVSTPIKDRGMLTGAVVVFRDMNTYN
ncbi:MAG: hypothetical protein COA36_14220 [Desulfotalea sp.]|nr:MAG: hypothetical protein COA36_14220 [Desulfotalea sp.]